MRDPPENATFVLQAGERGESGESLGLHQSGRNTSFFLFFFLGTRLLMCGYEETWFPVAKLSYVPRTTVGTGAENKTKL